MPRWLPLLRTLPALGFRSVLRVSLYRLALRLGIHPVLRLHEKEVVGPFFKSCECVSTGLTAPSSWSETGRYFGWAEFSVPHPAPDWHRNPFTGNRVAADIHWSKLPDFSDAGDIKAIWEASRFDWVIANAQRAREGDQTSLNRVNDWLDDWSRNNPAYRGANWKCGQEASIRVMHLAVAAMILGQIKDPLSSLISLIKIHLRRISPTIAYAVGQDNNHGTSEAAALFMGGALLQSLGHEEGAKWQMTGRAVLEERIKTLVAADGSFSQYSVVYHRVLIDTLIMTERWRVALDLKPFSNQFYDRAKAATLWLYAFVDAETGDAPNIGANDGAALLQLEDRDFRDFRPSVQMAIALFCDARAYPVSSKIDVSAAWLGIAIPETPLPVRQSRMFNDGGFAIINKNSAWGYLRFPHFTFRPSQADILHFDLWVAGECLLGDAGSYSYAADAKTYAYFSGTHSHNTIMFDNSDQMERLGRFLFADWPRSRIDPVISDQGDYATVSAGYLTRKGIRHDRKIQMGCNYVTITDIFSGFKENAVARWRLPAGNWTIDGWEIYSERFSLKFDATIAIERAEIVTGAQSVYYLEKHDCSVLEIEVHEAGTLTTRIEW
jgi:Heparinase II/III-like protein/Heparinase II/III N-terminus